MKKVILVLLVISLFVQRFYAQQENDLLTKSTENFGSIIMSTGVAYDTGNIFAFPFNKYSVKGCNYDFSFGFRRQFPNNWAYRVVFENSIYATDSGDGTPTGVGLFRSTTNLFELTARGEYSVKFGAMSQGFKHNSIYAFIGGGILAGNVVYHPDTYSGFPDFTAGILTTGLGYNYNIMNTIYIGAEYTIHYALIDKLDGYPLITKPGVRTCNDVLGSFTVTLGVRVF